jgi:energy-coupling factor transporter ATP-binding protein EcfA2
MTRWNISNIFFLSVSDERREVELKPGVMNIITGASGTGKSTLIKAIDYCLGSNKCELPAHVRRRSLAVGVKWTSGDAEMVIGRIVPPVGQATSTRMFTSSGRNLSLPATVADFDGATTLEAAKAFIERAFGIGDLGGEADASGSGRGRATVRHVTPYLFVTKEVIYSETVLLHGLEKADKARDILAAMPYFLCVNDEASAMAERQLRQLQRALDKEEARERSRAAADSVLKQRAVSLLAEAHRIGIAPAPSSDAAEADLLAQIKTVSETQLEANTYPSEGELGGLHARRREILGALGAARRQLQATRTAIREASGFEGAVTRQREKLTLAEHLHLQNIAGVCPVCDAPSERGRETARALQATLTTVRAESAAVERVKPKLVEHDRTLDEEIGRLNGELRQVDDQIRTWLRQSEDTRRMADLAQLRAHLLGRVSFFLESSVDEPRQALRDLSVLRAEIAELEARVDREAKEIKLRRAENKIPSLHRKLLRRCQPWLLVSALSSTSRPASRRSRSSRRRVAPCCGCRTSARTRIIWPCTSLYPLRCSATSRRLWRRFPVCLCSTRSADRISRPVEKMKTRPRSRAGKKTRMSRLCAGTSTFFSTKAAGGPAYRSC